MIGQLPQKQSSQNPVSVVVGNTRGVAGELDVNEEQSIQASSKNPHPVSVNVEGNLKLAGNDSSKLQPVQHSCINPPLARVRFCGVLKLSGIFLRDAQLFQVHPRKFTSTSVND